MSIVIDRRVRDAGSRRPDRGRPASLAIDGRWAEPCDWSKRRLACDRDTGWSRDRLLEASAAGAPAPLSICAIHAKRRRIFGAGALCADAPLERECGAMVGTPVTPEAVARVLDHLHVFMVNQAKLAGVVGVDIEAHGSILAITANEASLLSDVPVDVFPLLLDRVRALCGTDANGNSGAYAIVVEGVAMAVTFALRGAGADSVIELRL